MPLRPLMRLGLTLVCGVLLLQSCVYLQHERLIPVRRLLNLETQYWIDPVWVDDEPGREIEYYKNGRAASIRQYNELGKLTTIDYLDRNGDPIRRDSLVYDDGGRITGAYYYHLPYQQQILRYENRFNGDQLASRDWRDRADTLVSQEQFFFDRRGRKLLRIQWSPNMDVRALDVMDPRTETILFQNVYGPDSLLVWQTLYESGHAVERMQFDTRGRLVRIDHLGTEDHVLWYQTYSYDASGQTVSEYFFREDGLLMATQPARAINSRRSRVWSHPAKPGTLPAIWQFQRPQTLVRERPPRQQDDTLIEVRLNTGGQLIQRSVQDKAGSPVADTLYGRGQAPVMVVAYDSLGRVASWSNLGGQNADLQSLKVLRGPDERIMREEVFKQEQFEGALTYFYDHMGKRQLIEYSQSGGILQGSWRFFETGGLKYASRYDVQGNIKEAYGVSLDGDSLYHYDYRPLEFFIVEVGRDPAGNWIHQRRFTADGLMDWTVELDSIGRPLLEQRRRRNGTLYRQTEFNSDERIWIKSNYDPQGALLGQEITKLDTDGHKIMVQSRNEYGERVWERRRAFRNGRLLRAAQLDAEGKPLYISGFEYDARGLLKQEVAVNAEKDTVYVIDYRHDEKDHLIFETYRTPQGNMLSSHRYYHDDQGRVNREELINQRRLTGIIEYRYHPQYLLRVASYYDPDGELEREEIQSDYGNDVFATHW